MSHVPNWLRACLKSVWKKTWGYFSAVCLLKHVLQRENIPTQCRFVVSETSVAPSSIAACVPKTEDEWLPFFVFHSIPPSDNSNLSGRLKRYVPVLELNVERVSFSSGLSNILKQSAATVTFLANRLQTETFFSETSILSAGLTRHSWFSVQVQFTLVLQRKTVTITNELWRRLCKHRRRKGWAGGARFPWILKISAKKGCFLNFQWENPHYTTFGPSLEKFWKNPVVPPLEKILPTLMYANVFYQLLCRKRKHTIKMYLMVQCWSGITCWFC